MNGLTMTAVENATLRCISFGAGVQSTVMLFMACRGEIGPRPEHVIFADTGFEPREVYNHLRWCQHEVARLTNGQVRLHIVSAGNIRDDHLAGLNSTGQRFASMPLFNSDGGMTRRQCTKEYKVEPIRRKQRDLLGVKPRQRVPKGVVVEQWIGISTDEIQRAKASRDKWSVNRFPLIERRMSRADCRAWWERAYPGQPLVRSACISCPFRSDAEWRQMKTESPDDWSASVEFDDAIRENDSRLGSLRTQQFVHRSATPLATADLGDEETQDMFADECEGMCGV